MRRPNLLFIYTDEQAAGTMAAYGNDLIDTPNLNRLADESLVFQNAYVTQPVCTPSRSSILTGLYPHTNGCVRNNVPLAEEIECLPELSDFSDYRTAHIGKWHLGDEIFPQHGFDEWVSIDDAYRRYYSAGRDRHENSDYWHWLVDQGYEPAESADDYLEFSRNFTARLPEEHSRAAFVAGRTAQFLRDTGEEPFICYVNFFEPHMPFFGPRDDQYDPAEIPLPDNFDEVPGPDAPLKLRLLHAHYRHAGTSGLPLETEADWRRLIANYWGLCSQVDTYVGEILAALEAHGQAENTIVVYSSDHGDMMGSHQLVAKTVMYEESVRVPLLLRVPWFEIAGNRIEAPVSQVDLVPTLLDLLGRPVPSHLQGESWRPDLRHLDSFPEHDVIIEWNGADGGLLRQDSRTLPHHLEAMTTYEEAFRAASARVRTIITPTGWKFNCSPIGEHELYNLQEDPGEGTNLIDDPSVHELVADLYERLLQWQEATGDDARLASDPRQR